MSPVDEQLMRAAEDGRLDELRAALRGGADPDCVEGPLRWTPLMRACFGGHAECVAALVEVGGCDCDARQRHGMTALMWAAQMGHFDCVRLLLGSGRCDSRALDEKGRDAIAHGWTHGREAAWIVAALERDRERIEIERAAGPRESLPARSARPGL